MVYSLRLPTDTVGCWRGSRVTRVVVETDESFESALKRKALAARKKAKRRERTAD